MMNTDLPLFIDIELESYLPTGWRLVEANSGGWNPKKKGEWSVRVIDGADMDWDLKVFERDVQRLGRLEALKKAVDSLHRERLG